MRAISCGHLVTDEPLRTDLLSLDIDIRISDLWELALEIDEWTPEEFGVFIRAAYGRGYTDALTEPSRGILCSEHGYRVPKRSTDPSLHSIKKVT